MPVKLPGPGADDEPAEVARAEAGVAKQLVGVGEHRGGAGRPLAEHLAVEHERRGRDRGRRVEGENEPARACASE